MKILKIYKPELKLNKFGARVNGVVENGGERGKGAELVNWNNFASIFTAYTYRMSSSLHIQYKNLDILIKFKLVRLKNLLHYLYSNLLWKYRRKKSII